MLDDILIRALVAGVGIALIAGPLGCFVVWGRMAYFGDTMAHSALLGVALAYFFEFDPVLGVFLFGAGLTPVLIFMERGGRLSSDTVLGILSHSTLAIGLVMISMMTWLQIDLMHLLTGEILAVSKSDIVVILTGGIIILALLVWIWRHLLGATVNAELAIAENLKPERARIIFMLSLALLIALAVKIIGILLITSLLIIPAATARQFARSPEQMAVLASLLGAGAVCIGLFSSFELDLPSGPAIVVAALALFLLALSINRIKELRSREAS